MKSFLQQLEEAFELYEESDELIQYSDNEEDYKNWVRCIQKATRYANLTDIYDVRVIF
jgi:hypothetical protein